MDFNRLFCHTMTFSQTHMPNLKSKVGKFLCNEILKFGQPVPQKKHSLSSKLSIGNCKGISSACKQLYEVSQRSFETCNKSIKYIHILLKIFFLTICFVYTRYGMYIMLESPDKEKGCCKTAFN